MDEKVIRSGIYTRKLYFHATDFGLELLLVFGVWLLVGKFPYFFFITYF
jgi:hypothetical protein